MSRIIRKTRPAKIKKRTRSSEKKIEQRSLGREVVTIVLVVLGVFLFIALSSYLSNVGSYPNLADNEAIQNKNLMGPVGNKLAHLLISFLGWCAYAVAVWAFLLARTVWVVGWPAKSKSAVSLVWSILASVSMVVFFASSSAVIFGYIGGGAIGSKVSLYFIRYINSAGTLLVSLAGFVLFLGLSTGIGTTKLVEHTSQGLKAFSRLVVDCSFVFSRIVKALGISALWLVASGGGKVRRIIGMIPFLRRAIVRANREFPVVQGTTIQSRATGPLLLEHDKTEDEPYVLGELDDFEIEEVEEVDEPIKISRTERSSESSGLKSRIRRKKKPGKLLKRLRERNRALKQEEPAVEAFTEKDFSLPSTEMLIAGDEVSQSTVSNANLLKNSKRLEQALENFRVSGKITEVQPGPVITLYQFEPAAGIKVQRVINLSDDLAMALKVSSVRVYAPVPGKGTVGIEVPNAEREIVRLRESMEGEAFANCRFPLALALGKDTFGDPYIADLSAMPHLLIAGATGSGKSVCINSILLSLLYRNTPEQLKLILIDPKMLELSVYEAIPHLKAPVVTSPKRAKGVLFWAVEEMDRRYRLMRDLGVRNIAGYNNLVAKNAPKKKSDNGENIIELEERNIVATPIENGGIPRKDSFSEQKFDSENRESSSSRTLPRIVIVIDELADLMLTVGREIEELLTRLAQKARAAGIHLILATQRPSVNVVTGLIKANFPARISFKVATRIDSRTVLDTSGAEKLLGHGDLLFLSPASGKLKRLHAPFVSDGEVLDVANYLRDQGEPEYDRAIQKVMEQAEEREGLSAGMIEDEHDPLYDQAVSIVIEKGQASTSMVQRVFRIGYNRAARILEKMEREGLVGPADGAKPRQLLLHNFDQT